MIDSHSSSLQVIFNDWFNYLSGKRVGSDTVYSCNVNPMQWPLRSKTGPPIASLGSGRSCCKMRGKLSFLLDTGPLICIFRLNRSKVTDRCPKVMAIAFQFFS